MGKKKTNRASDLSQCHLAFCQVLRASLIRSLFLSLHSETFLQYHRQDVESREMRMLQFLHKHSIESKMTPTASCHELNTSQVSNIAPCTRHARHTKNSTMRGYNVDGFLQAKTSLPPHCLHIGNYRRQSP